MAEGPGEDREVRREVVRELGAALRELVDAAVRTEVPAEELAVVSGSMDRPVGAWTAREPEPRE